MGFPCFFFGPLRLFSPPLGQPQYACLSAEKTLDRTTEIDVANLPSFLIGLCLLLTNEKAFYINQTQESFGTSRCDPQEKPAKLSELAPI